ncbi:MAG: methyltransferase domain-containing protein [Anaerolineae bacterium]
MYSDLKLPAAFHALLRCPVCRAPLEECDTWLVCTHNAQSHRFPIVDGIPVLINDEASVFSVDDFIQRRSTFFDLSRAGQLVAVADRRLPSFHRTTKKKENMQRFVQALLARSSEPKVLVIGGSILGPGMEHLLRHAPPIQLVESDVSFGPRTNMICDAHDIPFEDGTFDGIIAQAVLHHVADPFRCVEEIYRVLSKEGVVYAETPFMQQVHAGPYDFTRFTHLGHRRLFRRFDEIDSGTGQGPGTALAWSYQYFLLGFATSKPMRALIRAFCRLTLFYLKYFDAYLGQRPGAFDASSGYFFMGRKSDRTLTDREVIRLYRGGIR